jgi:hypothetical protein
MTAVDFSDVDPEERGRNFTKCGGTQTADSPEKLAQDQREANTLSVFYTSPSDIPFSPKEPPPSSPSDSYSPEVPFGEPDEQTKVIFPIQTLSGLSSDMLWHRHGLLNPSLPRIRSCNQLRHRQPTRGQLTLLRCLK